jgi:uncharacterized membrane protein
VAAQKTARKRTTSQRMAAQRPAARPATADGTVEPPPAPPARTGERPGDGPGGAPVPAAPRWPWISGLLVSLLGLGVAAYLTYDHFSNTAPAACPDTGTINCLKVTTSSYSVILGVPVAVLGLVFFLVMIGLQLPRMWASHDVRIRRVRMAWAGIGMVTALWLVYAELFRINAICLYCTSVHILTLIVFATTAIATAFTADTYATQ